MSDEQNGTPGEGQQDPEKENPGENVANRYFSIEVIPPEEGGGASKEEGGSHTESSNYFRMGAPDDETEGKLPPNPNEPEKKGEKKESPWRDGIVLYTTGSYQLKAKSSRSWSSDEVEVVTDDSGSSLVSAELTTGALGGFGPSSISYKHLNELTANIGTAITSSTGIEQNVWQGLYTHFGLGNEFNGVVGSKVDLEYAQSIKMEREGLHLGGIGGDIEAEEHHYVATTDEIRLSSSPANKILVESWTLWTSRTARYSALVGAMAASLLTVAAATQDAVSWTNDSTPENFESKMRNTQIELGAAMAVYSVIQVGIMLAAFITRSASATAAVTADAAKPDACVLSLRGLPGRAYAYLQAGSARQLLFDSVGDVTLLDSLPGRKITLNAGTIELVAGPSKITLGPAGITLQGALVTAVSGANNLTVNNAGINLGSPSITVLPIGNPNSTTLVAAINAEIAASAAATEAAKVAQLASDIASLEAWTVDVFGKLLL